MAKIKLTIKQQTDIQVLQYAIETVQQGGELVFIHVRKPKNKKARAKKVTA